MIGLGKISFTPLVAIMLAGLSACASHDKVSLSESASVMTGEAVIWQAQSESASTATALTDLVSVEGLQSYIDEALENNASLQQTLITLRKAQVAIKSADSADNLNLDASFSGSKIEGSNESYTAGLTVSWELDLWQKISDSVDAASFDAASARSAYQSSRDALVASIIRSYLDIITQQQLLAIEQERLRVYENSESIILKRYRTGLGSLDDLDNAKTSSATTRASIALYENTISAAKRTLAVLLGRQDQTLSDFPSVTEFPDVLEPLLALPEQDLARRPDLQAAYYGIKASEANVKVAYKALLPSINLSAGLTDTGTSPSQSLFTNPLWNLLGQVTAPLFQGGALRAQIDDAELTALNSWWEYRETLLTAVQEVQDALDNEKALSQRQYYTNIAYQNALSSADTFSGQYRQGLVDILDLLSVYDTTFNLQAQRVELQNSQLSNRIDLGLALGLGVSQ
ncbi:TolC family protein [Alteromonas naphthalenivorans]|uniref:RND efflux system outer membrane lipoprotein n=1 Tax=Alteromonas naphthalenivorans TaxID=715451 RepID=F5Z534_ALTNA|nr:TolC family protein [Alteromonas naphthalenivorans]AEF04601.1 RND efflux system outer membrane lipoprotein [Alteromonas naphthalenivorans]